MHAVAPMVPTAMAAILTAPRTTETAPEGERAQRFSVPLLAEVLRRVAVTVDGRIHTHHQLERHFTAWRVTQGQITVLTIRAVEVEVAVNTEAVST